MLKTKTKRMCRYSFSFLLILLFTSTNFFAQQASSGDTITYKEKYGLRVGLDLSKPVRSFLQNEYAGFEIIGDYRIYDNYYAAAEIGTEKLKFEDDNIKATSNGRYIKLGADYNAYDNWQDMQNSIFVGVRYGFSTFSQDLEGYRIYTSTNYFGPDFRLENVGSTGLNASWIELMAGIKVEIFNNLFLSANVQLKRIVTQKAPSNFDNLTIPGFGRTYDGSDFGAGFGYSISYLLPFYKKEKD